MELNWLLKAVLISTAQLVGILIGIGIVFIALMGVSLLAQKAGRLLFFPVCCLGFGCLVWSYPNYVGAIVSMAIALFILYAALYTTFSALTNFIELVKLGFTILRIKLDRLLH